ncbi:MAG: hypothetical protein Q7R52_02655 [archaeon]|nr:hypothetical protein [archaeon]
MAEDLEKTINGICPICVEQQTFSYIGSSQKQYSGEKIRFYNCDKCSGTYGISTILEFTKAHQKLAETKND